MATTPLSSIAAFCDKLLQKEKFTDWDGAANGLQVENRGSVRKIAAAVDASLATIKLAIEAKADLLIVHHGLFWSPTHPWTGKRHEMIRLLVENNLCVERESKLEFKCEKPIGTRADSNSLFSQHKKRV